MASLESNTFAGIELLALYTGDLLSKRKTISLITTNFNDYLINDECLIKRDALFEGYLQCIATNQPFRMQTSATHFSNLSFLYEAHPHGPHSDESLTST